MRASPFVLLTIVVTFMASNCWGHGYPIVVDVVNQRLTISDGFTLPSGFIGQAFDRHEDNFLDVAPGFTLASTLPGYDINGMEVGSQLNLEVVPRPDFTTAGTPNRWLWYWDDASDTVKTAPNDPTLEIASENGFGSVLLTQFTTPSTGPSLKVAEPTASDLGSHEHPLAYFLDNSPPAPTGVYGFFMRLTSPAYASSETILVALNNTDPANFDRGARLINAAAQLPGDYDNDDDNDGADFLAWQRTLNSTTALAADWSLNNVVDGSDFTIWNNHFGQKAPGIPMVAVPEPNVALMAAMAVAAFAARVRRRAPSLPKTGSHE
jgi:hypothetical protein